jgi:RNA recognition motif-containing protein
MFTSIEATIITRGHRSLGYGFITFETEKDATKSIQVLDHQSLDGREINVEVARPKAPVTAPAATEKAVAPSTITTTTNKSKRNNTRRHRNRDHSKASATNVSLTVGMRDRKRTKLKISHVYISLKNPLPLLLLLKTKHKKPSR